MVHQRGRIGLSPRIIWLSLLMLSAVLFVLYQQGQDRLVQQQEEMRELSQEHYEQTMQTESLRQAKAQVGSDRYIEQQARKQYGYMMPDEIRFVVTDTGKQTLTDVGAAAPAAVVQAETTPQPAAATQAPQQQDLSVENAVPAPTAQQTDWTNAFN